MAGSFLKAKSLCDRCPLEEDHKKGKLKKDPEEKGHLVLSDCGAANVDILFLTDMTEKEKDRFKIEKLVQNLGVKNYVIVPAIGCRTTDYKLPSPLYSTYTHCKSFHIDTYNPKVVITLGRAYLWFTRGSVFDTFSEFNEYLFNDTYFYPHITSKWKGRIYPAAHLSEVFDSSSFGRFHFEFQVKQAVKHAANYEQEKFIMPKYAVTIIENFSKFLDNTKDEKIVALDTETSSLDMFRDDFKVGCLQASFDGETGYVLPMKLVDNKRKLSSWLQSKFQIWANGKYDCKSLNRMKITGHHVDEDIPLIYHLLNTERTSNSIKVLSWFIGFGGYEDALDEYKHKYKIDSYLDIPESILYPYAGMDAIVTYRLYKYMKDNLVPRQRAVYDLYQQIVIPVIPVFQSMEEEGLLVNQNYVQTYHTELVKRLETLKSDIYKLLGKTIDIGSNDELGKALEEVGLPDYGRNLKGLYRTGNEILVQWEKDGFEVIKKLLEYRKLSKLDGTFVGEISEDSDEDMSPLLSVKSVNKETNKKEKGIQQYIASDGRVHGTIMPALTDSWRSLCVTGDTLVSLSDDTKIAISSLVEQLPNKAFFVKTHKGNCKKVINGWKKDIVPVYCLTLEDGKSVKLTASHKVWTDRGWIAAKCLNLKKHLVLTSTAYVRIKSILPVGEEQVYDIEAEGDHSFFGNEIALHNSFSPNLQNFPKQGAEGEAFRKVFIAPEDFLIGEADYSGFQLRLMGIYSNDQVMADAFIKIQDLHSVTGCNVFSQGTDLTYFIAHKDEEPFHTHRQNGKNTNLAFTFNQSPYSFQAKIKNKWTEEQIDSYIKNNTLEIICDKDTGRENKCLTVATGVQSKFFSDYYGLKKYILHRQSLACEQGFVVCPVFPGAVRHLPELTHLADRMSKEKASHYSTLKNIAVNAEAQAGEALNVYLAARRIFDTIREKGLKSRLVGCVHDSLVSYVHKSEIEIMYHVLKDSMERFDYSIPILAEIEMGSVWGFGKKITDKNLKSFAEENKI